MTEGTGYSLSDIVSATRGNDGFSVVMAVCSLYYS